MREESGQRMKTNCHIGNYDRNDRQRGVVPLHPMAMHQGVVHFGIFRRGKYCKSPTSLRVVRDGFASGNTLYEGNTRPRSNKCQFLALWTRVNSNLHVHPSFTL